MNRELSRWSFKKPGEGATSSEIMQYGTTGEKIEEGIVLVASTAIGTGLLAGPLVIGTYFEVVGVITQNPEMIQSGNGLMLLQAEIYGGIFSLVGLAKGIKSMALRLRIQKTPEQILVTLSKNPILDRN